MKRWYAISIASEIIGWLAAVFALVTLAVNFIEVSWFGTVAVVASSGCLVWLTTDIRVRRHRILALKKDEEKKKS